MSTLAEPQLRPRYDGLQVTREEYLDLEEDGYRYEVINGVMYMAPSPSFDHNQMGHIFLRLVDKYLEIKHLGEVIYETDVLLPDGDDPLRPDISFILNENMHIIKTHIHGTPDIVCEVLSPATRDRDLGIKANRYLKCGVKEYYIIDPANKTLGMWINQTSLWEKFSAESKTSPALTSRLLPGFIVSWTDIFRET